MSIVQTNINYNYYVMKRDLSLLISAYPFLYVDSIGESVLGNSIPYVKFGRGQKQVFYNASFHANEWITTVLLMKFIENLCIAYSNNTNIFRNKY